MVLHQFGAELLGNKTRVSILFGVQIYCFFPYSIQKNNNNIIVKEQLIRNRSDWAIRDKTIERCESVVRQRLI